MLVTANVSVDIFQIENLGDKISPLRVSSVLPLECTNNLPNTIILIYTIVKRMSNHLGYLSMEANERFLVKITFVHLIAVDRFALHSLSPF